jgi:A/G-specific adenine glycosylase
MEFDADLLGFQRHVWDFYRSHGRMFSWRNVANPYYIVVSEIMLQQTQTSRVEGKYECFIQIFPDFKSLAKASLRDILLIWQGLGYNRRAKALHDCARKVVAEFGGVVPQSQEILLTFPGIALTASASICAFAFNQPTIFVETNIRAVFIHHFFKKGSIKVHDSEILLLVQQTIDKKDPRNWHYAS